MGKLASLCLIWTQNVVSEDKVVMIPSGYSFCWLIFDHCYLKKEDLGYNNKCQPFSSEYRCECIGLSVFRKWSIGMFKFYVGGYSL